jgi:hypothetical protein
MESINVKMRIGQNVMQDGQHVVGQPLQGKVSIYTGSHVLRNGLGDSQLLELKAKLCQISIPREKGVTDNAVKSGSHIKENDGSWFSRLGGPMKECSQEMMGHISALTFTSP